MFYLDVFLDPRPHGPNSSGRLSSSEYTAWSPNRVEQYLIERCGLSATDRVPGRIVTCHHELFDVWERLIADGDLIAPFSVTHIDSHADMGMGDAAYVYIMRELLHSDVTLRPTRMRDNWNELAEGNYLAFAIACRWLSGLNYVQHPETRRRNHGRLPDIGDAFFENNDPTCDTIQLKVYSQEIEVGLRRITEYEPIALEPSIPIAYYDRDTFETTDRFSYCFVAISPSYTPETVDLIIPTIEKFIVPI